MNSGAQDHSELTPGALEPVRAGLLHDGVAIVPGLVPADLCADAREAIDGWQDAGAGLGACQARTDRGRVPVNQHPALWAIRQHPPVYSLFRALLGTPFLWVTVDEGLHDPAGARCGHELDCGFSWHVDPRVSGRQLCGLVLLSDLGSDRGAFRCVPHIFRNPQPWWSIYGVEPIDARRIRDEQVHSVSGDAGSLVLWDARLPTGRGPNDHDAARYGMFLTMHEEGDAARRAERVRNFAEGLPPAWTRRLPRQPEPGSLGEAGLTVLGERLLGRTPW